MRLLPFEYGVRNLGRSPARLVAIVLGSTLVVSLVLAAAAFVRGMERSMVVGVNDSNVILLATGSEESLERSQVNMNAAGIIAADIPGIKTRLGVPFVSPEIHVALLVRTELSGTGEFRVVVRGVEPTAFLVHPRVEIVQGRAPTPGKDEIMVGELVSEKMGVSTERLRIGKSLWFDKRAWTIVGHFRAPGTVMNAEVWTPLTDLQVATKRATVSCIVITLDNATFEDIDAFTKMRFDLGLTGIQESEYYGALMKFYRPVHLLIWITAILIALGGLLGGVNTMYAAFASRAREIGTLQSLGFSRGAIAAGLLQESVLATAGGTLIGCTLSKWLIDGQAVRLSMGVFQLTIDHKVLLMGLVAGLFVGLIGALPPILRCLSMPIDQALKAA